MSINNDSPSLGPLHSLPPRVFRGHIRLHSRYESPVYRPRSYVQDVAERRYAMAKPPEWSQRLPKVSLRKRGTSEWRGYSPAQNTEQKRGEDRHEGFQESPVFGFPPRSAWQWPEMDGEQDKSVELLHPGDRHSSSPASYDFDLVRSDLRSAPAPTPRLSQTSLVTSPSYSESLESDNALFGNITIEHASPTGPLSRSGSTWQSLDFFPRFASSTDQQLVGLGIDMSFDEPEDTKEA